jgi:hypothetical protein
VIPEIELELQRIDSDIKNDKITDELNDSTNENIVFENIELETPEIGISSG